MRRVVIVGAGIVGSALAAYLGERSDADITVLERGPAGRLVPAPDRFAGRADEELTESSLRLYRDIYASDQAGAER